MKKNWDGVRSFLENKFETKYKTCNLDRLQCVYCNWAQVKILPINQSNIDFLQVKIICIARSSTIVHKLFKRNDQLPYQEYSVAPRSLDCIRRGTLRLMGSQRCQPFVHSGLLRLIALAQRLGTYLHGLFLSPLLAKRSLPLPWLCVKATLAYCI